MVNYIQKSDNGGTSELPLPTRPDQVTSAWLEAALRVQHPELKLRAAHIVDVIPGTSTKIRVRLNYASGGSGMPVTLIVKGGFEAHSPALKPMYINEMRFYRDVQPHVEIPSPRCFYAGSDPGSHQSIVIMEDLVSRGVRFCDPLLSQTPEQVARRLTAMARYHAQTWNSPLFQPGERFDWISGRHEGWSLTYRDHYLDPTRWAHYISLPRGAAISRRLCDRDWMVGALTALSVEHRHWPVCLCHGDTHLGNLYEEVDGAPGFFDAQVARGPWQLEVTYHLVGALDIADRRLHERPLLRHYFQELATHGVTPPDFATAWDAHRREVVYGLFIFLINETRFQTESVNTAYTARFGAAALDYGVYR